MIYELFRARVIVGQPNGRSSLAAPFVFLSAFRQLTYVAFARFMFAPRIENRKRRFEAAHREFLLPSPAIIASLPRQRYIPLRRDDFISIYPPGIN